MKNPSRQNTAAKASRMRALRHDRYDADRAEHADQSVAGISGTAERASSTIDDGVNAIEASEERYAAYEAQAMREREH
ncbi:hypothetical protein [Pseudoduganella rhizocola]|uniref:hypothetical protein n=1 Tax=Pseudoduganella rhizocola TaxID=3382643 RepID=UPI0038B58334